MKTPGFWMNETGGLLREVVEAYVKGLDLTEEDVGLMRDYLWQWVDADVWDGGARLDKLRERVARIRTRKHIEACIREAVDLGMDPL